ncbi:MAG: TetR/AcrR family transcriptional regulator C-terminal domain-containing protein [Bacillota bacterium]|nr:TetR/AcrR family transcriptional regulator C-terminal domain-containing protein [Bacillota bacterium]
MYHKKQDKRSIQSCDLIYMALVQLLKEKTFESISVKDIVDRANIGRTTFYRNFDAIEDVLRLKCDESFDGLKEYLINNTQSPLILKTFLRYWYLDSKILEILIHIKRTDIIFDSFSRIIEDFLQIIDTRIGTPIQHKNYFIAIRIGVALNILEQWIKDGKNIPPDDLADLIKTQFTDTSSLRFLF